MKALTLSQPWAELVAAGRKRYETRSWSTKYRGPLVIHAAAKGSSGISAVVLRAMAASWGFDPRVPFGAAVAVCELVDVHPVEEVYPRIGAEEREFGDYSPGRYAWELAGVRRLETPVPARGALGLWVPPSAVREAVG